MRKARWVVLAIFVILLSVWLYQGFNYPYPVYDYQQTGQVVEWFDRASWWAVDAVPVWVPDNPLWVDIIRKVAPFSLFALALALIYFAVETRRQRAAY